MKKAVEELLESARKNEASAPRKHHIVPNFYLAQWTKINLKRYGKLKVTDLTSQKSYLATSATAARETDFYSLKSPDLDPTTMPPLLVETMLSGIEGRGKTAIDRLIDDGPAGLDLYQAIDAAAYFAFTFTRGRHFRDMTSEATNLGAKLMFGNLSDDGIARRIEEGGAEPTAEAIQGVRRAIDAWNDGILKLAPQKAQLVGLAAEMATKMAFYFIARPWRVYRSVCPLLTCDEPVVLIGGPSCSRRQRSGVAKAGVIAFPLDPYHLLVMFHPGLALDEFALFPELLPSETMEINFEIAANAVRWIFEVPTGRLGSTMAMPPRPAPAVFESINVVNDPDGSYLRSFSPNRWRFGNPPPWPVSRWWRQADGFGPDCVPYEWEDMPDALFGVLG